MNINAIDNFSLLIGSKSLHFTYLRYLNRYCNMQGVARHWRNPVRTRVTSLDSSDALYIVYLAYTVKPMDNVVCFQHLGVEPVRFTHAPIISLPCAFFSTCASVLCFYARHYSYFNLCVFQHLCVYARHYS